LYERREHKINDPFEDEQLVTDYQEKLEKQGERREFTPSPWDEMMMMIIIAHTTMVQDVIGKM
jgi:hypothetical protein